jgi:hypothetical protein
LGQALITFSPQTAIENNAELLHNDRDFEAIASVSSLKLYQIAV